MDEVPLDSGPRTSRPPLYAQRRMSTGLKMLAILVLALLPLGLIAIFASREAAHVNRLRHQAEASAVATAAGSTMTDKLRLVAVSLRRSSDMLADAAPVGDRFDPVLCRKLVAHVLSRHRDVRGAALFDNRGRRVCASSGFSGMPAHFPVDATGYEARLSQRNRLLRVSMTPGPGKPFGVAEFPAEALARLAAATSRAKV